VVPPGGTSSLVALAADPAGGVLGYAWSASCGSFSAAGSPATEWTAPSGPGGCDLGIRVVDGSGRSTTVYVPMQVQ
jgi:hypothetical protein